MTITTRPTIQRRGRARRHDSLTDTSLLSLGNETFWDRRNCCIGLLLIGGTLVIGSIIPVADTVTTLRPNSEIGETVGGSYFEEVLPRTLLGNGSFVQTQDSYRETRRA